MADDITYQNKDVIFKILSENYKNKSLAVYGLKDLAPIKGILPTNLPAVKLDEKRADGIFELTNDMILISEYESSGSAKHLIKYGHYAFRVAEKYPGRKIEIAVIYTGDVKTAADTLDLGCIQLKIRQVFLSAFDGDAIYAELARKMRAKERLSDEDVMRFIILPLTAKDDKQKLIESTVSIAKEIDNEPIQNFIIAGILSATDKFIDKDYSNKLKEWLSMTKVGRLYEEEKIAYAKDYADKKVKEERLENEKKLKAERLETAKTLLKNKVDISIIMETTGLSKPAILKLKKNPAEPKA